MFMRTLCRSLVFTFVCSTFLFLQELPHSWIHAQDAPELIELKEESSQDAQDVYADGAAYQNGGKYAIAIEEWVKFRDQFSDDPKAPKSIYYLGICSLQLKKYDDAAAALNSLPRDMPSMRIQKQLSSTGEEHVTLRPSVVRMKNYGPNICRQPCLPLISN